MSEDADGAVQLWLLDSTIDDMYNRIFDNLLVVMMKDPRQISASTDLLFVAKNLERIGDHATNICEAIYYTINGTQLINDPALVGRLNTG